MFARKKWTTPAGAYPSIYGDMLDQPHLLIAGATGSGKSVVINGIIYAAMYDAPSQKRFILIDPKKVELAEYSALPHTELYASEPRAMLCALKRALEICTIRYADMQRRHLRMYDGSDLYVVIDELADLLTVDDIKRPCKATIQRLCQIGRAARVHVIGATQRPTGDVIGNAITCNMDARVALHTRNKQESRNIMGLTGCEALPRYGYGYYLKPEGSTLYRIPMIPDADRARIIAHWTRRRAFCR